MSECKHFVTFCGVCQTCKRKLDGEEIAERKAYWKREDEKRRACQRRSTKLRDAEREVLEACVAWVLASDVRVEDSTRGALLNVGMRYCALLEAESELRRIE